MKKQYAPYAIAEQFAQSLNLKSEKQWRAYYKETHPENLPLHPDFHYDEWQSWGVFLGTGTIASQNLPRRSFEEARAYAHTLNLTSRKEWKAFCASGQKPNDIPCKPWQTYAKDGWVDLGDWLGTFRIRTRERKYFHYEKARDIVHTLNIKTHRQWREWRKPEHIPAAPNMVYKNSGWISWNDWFGHKEKSMT